jgi:hypothetical protein
MRTWRTIVYGLGIAIAACGSAAAQDRSGSLPEPPINFPKMPTPADPWAGDGEATGAPAQRTGPLRRLRHRLTDLTPTEKQLLSSPRSPMAAYGARPPAPIVSPATPSNGGLPSSDPGVSRVAAPLPAEPSRPTGATGVASRTGQQQPPTAVSGGASLRPTIPPPRSFSPGAGKIVVPPPRSFSAGADKIVIPPPPSAPIPLELQALQTVSPATAAK